jgi:hypothetical protein
MKRFMTFVGVLFIAGSLLVGAAEAQADAGTTGNPLSLACTHPVFGSVLKVRLIGAPPGSLVTFYKTDSEGYREMLGESPADSSGCSLLEYSLLDSSWVGRDLTLWAEVATSGAGMDLPGGEGTDGLSGRERTPGIVSSGVLDIHVLNPSLFLPCMEPDGNGSIARFDQKTGTLSVRSVIPGGKPGRILFNRDGSRGFVILDSDQIGVFDPCADEWLFWFVPTGRGIVDVAATPDGTKIVVVCSGRRESDQDEILNGSLWVYDIDPEVEILSEPVTIGPVNPAGSDRVLTISDDSRLVYIKTGGSSFGEYNLETGHYKPLFIDSRYAPCTIKEILVHDNRLVLLFTRPDGEGYLCLSSMQTYRQNSISVGWHPVMFDIFEGESGPVAVVLHHSDGRNSDVLDVVDLTNLQVTSGIIARWQRGIRDVKVNDVRDHGVILYVPGGESARQGYLLFFDRETLRLRRDIYVQVPVDEGSRLFLSRSIVVNRCYVLNRSGTLTVVDLDLFRKAGVHELDAEVLLPPAEYN